MALLQILEFPDPRLRTRGQPVTQVDAALRKLGDDMFETMYAAPGVGLAATQVGVAQQLAVMDCATEDGQREPLVLINPEIFEPADPQTMEEGCLSVPGARESIRRYNRLRFRALDRDGKPYEKEAEGLLAQCVQHELDHLNGKLYIDYLSSLKRERIRKRLEQDKREAASKAGAR